MSTRAERTIIAYMDLYDLKTAEELIQLSKLDGDIVRTILRDLEDRQKIEVINLDYKIVYRSLPR